MTVDALTVVDRLGVMIPYIADPISSLKVALTGDNIISLTCNKMLPYGIHIVCFHNAGGVKDDVADKEIMADYLLWRLNHFNNFRFLSSTVLF